MSKPIKLLFVMQDLYGTYLDMTNLGYSNAPKRRAVTIELTEEQMEQLNIQHIGVNCGKEMFEDIQSVSVQLENNKPEIEVTE